MQFRQSIADFPLTVSLGEKKPSFGLKRFNQGLRFIPPDDEGFTLRGDRRRLLYKGRRRSHRFTILGDCSFEYDCILLKEPESNVITLRMEGAENFDFLRQPDFLKDPLLSGSFAVYKKDTVVGEGTGKLCHIHRPEIIDARGRRCWGELSVVGNELRVTIPENWLGEAKYPVVVDPTVGTTTVGSLTTGPDPNNSGYDRPWLDCEYTVNKFLVPQNGGGVCTAYVYAYNDEADNYIKTMLYTNNNNKPYLRKSKNEKDVYVMVWPEIGYPVGWRNNTFELVGNITAGEYVRFGLYDGFFTTRFDYGGECYKGQFNWDLCPEDEGWLPSIFNITPWDTFCTIKWSMYFTYTAAQNYIRTLTQGIKLTDKRKLTGNYKRTSTQTVKINSASNRLPIFFRNVLEQINVTFSKVEKMSLERKCANVVIINSNTDRIINFIRFIQESLKNLDTQYFSVLFVRSVNDTAMGTGFLSKIGSFIRGLYFAAGSIAETVHKAEYNRFNSDTVQTEGRASRGLLLFVRIVTQVLFRDYLLRRFLIAKEELILKSAICKEITLESRID